MDKIKQVKKEHYIGIRMMQHWNTISIFNKFLSDQLYFNDQKFSRIIEFGTAYGGFALFLAQAAFIQGVEFYTIDIQNKLIDKTKKILQYLNTKIITNDIMNINPNNILSSGRNLILCDGGTNRPEFECYAKHINTNDVIMIHDYWRKREDYDRSIWKGKECFYKDIEKACKSNRLIPYYSDEMQSICWGSFIKR